MGEPAAGALAAYLDRIVFAGPREPTLPVLRELVLRHALTFPFENIDPLLGLTPRLDPDSLTAKLVIGRRGGYCFEQNLLLAHHLRALGFGVRTLGARVLFDQPAGSVPPRTHLLLEVTAETEAHLVDVGFGGLTPTGPIPFVPDEDVATPHGIYRIIADGSGYELGALFGAEWKPLYRFDMGEDGPADHEMANHYVATWPASTFRSRLIVVRALPGGRVLLENDRLAFRSLDGGYKEIRVPSGEALLGALANPFGLEVADPDRVKAAFERVRSSEAAIPS